MIKRLLLMLLVMHLISMGMAAECSHAAKEGREAVVIQTPKNASFLEKMAAQEIRRYVYLRTGEWANIVDGDSAIPSGAYAILATAKNRPEAIAVAKDIDSPSLEGLNPQQYWLKTIERKNYRLTLAAGGGELGVLYAAYHFAEALGVRFYLHGDVIPDERWAGPLPALDEKGGPLFDLRGIQPFHDFPEGPDWWNLDDYKAILAQLPKMGMNFFALHTYPENHPNAEPTVWIGLPQDIGEGSQVKFSYPSSYMNTLRGNWGYDEMNTSDFVYGGGALFEEDAYGADVMLGKCPQPDSLEKSNELFQETGDMLGDAFRFARQLGIKTCAGTETPLIIPKSVQLRLKMMGKDPEDPAVVQELYEGMFKRIMQTCPLDYYWFWTPEEWTWSGNTGKQVEATKQDLLAADAARKKIGAPFTLATCGWVLGPVNDRALFDKFLPKEMPMSCINREVGKTPVDPAFARVQGRPTWAIPWMEDDPGLLSPQLWAGRMRADAADALKYRCNGLMGIHWRTRILGPNVSALAKAGWSQKEWYDPSIHEIPAGENYISTREPIAHTKMDALYQSASTGAAMYSFAAPQGKYSITLRFCEMQKNEKGKRVFNVKIQDRIVIAKLDIFAEAGKDAALDFHFAGIESKDGRIVVELIPLMDAPCLSAISIRGKGYANNLNCGGEAYRNFDGDWPPAKTITRDQPILDFYRDWARCEFGAEAAEEIATIFTKIDKNTPRPSEWQDGPGSLIHNPRSWPEMRQEYAFVDELESLRRRIIGAGNLSRFDYWLNSFRFMRATEKIDCAWSVYDKAMQKVKAEKDSAKQKEMAVKKLLPLRAEIVKGVEEAFRFLLPTVSNTGEMGTVANLNQHSLTRLLYKPGEELEKLLGAPLPADCQPSKELTAPAGLAVPTVRGCLSHGEPLSVKALVWGVDSPCEAAVHWRPIGEGEWRTTPLEPIGRGVYKAEIPTDKLGSKDLEYYVRVSPKEGKPLLFPATAPELNQTVIILPE
ncbi:MAG: malectin domain-containing carbohydrate-binding protein [Candidatus Omnitrophota bacterium]